VSFETVVRVHRAGEGASFEGLKEGAGNPALVTADRAVEAGTLKGLGASLDAPSAEGLRQRFARLMAAKKHDPSDVAAGRAYVKAYVDFIHYAERVLTPGRGSGEIHSH
jgi:hypothetical protein